MNDITGQRLKVGDTCVFLKYSRDYEANCYKKTMNIGKITHFTPKKVGFAQGTAYPEEVCKLSDAPETKDAEISPILKTTLS